MRSAIDDIPVTTEMPEATLRHIKWGDMTIEAGQCRQYVNEESFLKGLPDNRCQSPHWGYVLKGEMRFKYDGYEEVFRAGDVYYAPPGHIPYFEANCEYIEFSPTEAYKLTIEAIKQNVNTQP